MTANEKIRCETLEGIKLAIKKVFRERCNITSEGEKLLAIDFAALPEFYKASVEDYVMSFSPLELSHGNFPVILNKADVPSDFWVIHKCYLLFEDSKWGLTCKVKCRYTEAEKPEEYKLLESADFEVLEYDKICALFKDGEEEEVLTDFISEILNSAFEKVG